MTERRTLKLTHPMMHGDDVAELQRFLSMGNLVSGQYNLPTSCAVEKYQDIHGLLTDGICGPKTWAHIDAEIARMSDFATYCIDVDPDRKLVIDSREDALWLMRMCVGEGGRKCSTRKASVMLWALVNRWLLWPGSRHFIAFIDMVRAFSQPINLRWQEGGDLAIKYSGTAFSSPERLKRRAEICAMKYDEIPEQIRSTVEQFVRGHVPYPKLGIKKGRISNWASLSKTPTEYPWGVYVNRDWFFEDVSLRDGKVVVKDKG